MYSDIDDGFITETIAKNEQRFCNSLEEILEKYEKISLEGHCNAEVDFNDLSVYNSDDYLEQMKSKNFAFSTDYCLPLQDRLNIRKKQKMFKKRNGVLYKGYRERKHILSSKSKSLRRKNKDSQKSAEQLRKGENSETNKSFCSNDNILNEDLSENNSESLCENSDESSYHSSDNVNINDSFKTQLKVNKESSKKLDFLTSTSRGSFDKNPSDSNKRFDCSGSDESSYHSSDNESSKGIDFLTSTSRGSFDKNQLDSNKRFGSRGGDRGVKNLNNKLCERELDQITPVSNRFPALTASKKRKRSDESKSSESNCHNVSCKLLRAKHSNINVSAVKKFKNNKSINPQKYTSFNDDSGSLKGIDALFSHHSPIVLSPFTVMRQCRKTMVTSKDDFASTNSKIVLNGEEYDPISTPSQFENSKGRTLRPRTSKSNSLVLNSASNSFKSNSQNKQKKCNGDSFLKIKHSPEFNQDISKPRRILKM